jgi:uncharacterized lipoprotein YmbA
MRIRSLWFRFQVLLAGVGLAAGLGCAGSPPAKFYTLSPLATTGEVKSEKGPAGQTLAIGIGPVRLPQYLARKEIVTRADANTIDLAEYDLWGGSLQDDFSRNLMENLSLLLAGDRVSLFPWPGMGALDYRVGVEVMRFDGNRGGDVVLIATWTIREGQGGKLVRVQTSRIQEPSGGQGYEAMVGGMSRALGRLSREIGEAIKTLPR